jgi:molecular chaperone IbpA
MNTSKALRILSDDILNSNFVGFDRFFDQFSNVATNAYPPHNVIRLDDDTRQLEFALAGFSSDDVSIEVKDNILTITGDKTVEDDKEYIWRGISSRKFVKQFSLTDYWEVDGAAFEDGILTISLHREVPEALKPKTIKIEHKKS